MRGLFYAASRNRRLRLIPNRPAGSNSTEKGLLKKPDVAQSSCAARYPPHEGSGRLLDIRASSVPRSPMPRGESIPTGMDFFNSPGKGGQGGFFRRGKPMTEKQEEPCWKRQKRESRERIKQKIARESGRYCIEAPNIIDKPGSLDYIRYLFYRSIKYICAVLWKEARDAGCESRYFP